MRIIPLVVTGLGKVGLSFIRLLEEKAEFVRNRAGVDFVLMGAVKSDGSFHGSAPLTRAQVLQGDNFRMDAGSAWRPGMGLGEILQAMEPETGCLVDCTPSNLKTGEPGLAYFRISLTKGWSVVAASKGALAIAFRELRDLALRRGCALKFSAAAAAALPTLDVGLLSLSGSTIEGIQGILNGTSNSILTRMGDGKSYEESLKDAQDEGIAEPDPSFDVEGHDTAGKLLLIANVCLDGDFTMDAVRVRGITAMSPEEVRTVREAGRKIKLLGTCLNQGKGGGWRLEVRPTVLERTHPLFNVDGTEKGISFETDTMGTITVIGGRSNPRGAAAALLKDLINIYRPA